ncbi:hypothetical protein AC578_4789 [Pseudocercospora eumusae]|uniref:Uncharacterized protein n=1 Tax=Pseudocercospora eumusae TaxID=321146 RepID=A0A139HLL6_9PEZI|nr:hypothetical protein AC578_4789 [Pseudocercospora eumusae]
MLCLSTQLVALAALAASVRSAVLTERQTTTAIVGSFYCYGEETAYIGVLPPPQASLSTNVTFQDEAESSLTVTANSTEELPATTFFINTSAGAFEAAGFVAPSNTTVTTSGFKVFGNQLVWITESGELEQLWWAEPTDVEGLWLLKWNVDAVTDTNAIPVNVKNVAPVNVGSSDAAE